MVKQLTCDINDNAIENDLYVQLLELYKAIIECDSSSEQLIGAITHLINKISKFDASSVIHIRAVAFLEAIGIFRYEANVFLAYLRKRKHDGYSQYLENRFDGPKIFQRMVDYLSFYFSEDNDQKAIFADDYLKKHGFTWGWREMESYLSKYKPAGLKGCEKM
tara:strand:+ start:1301 stop:1789 length:489 start_codon:yes stop_codon:yes gene_type:complete